MSGLESSHALAVPHTKSFDQAFEQICQLSAQFQVNERHYCSELYQESEVRADFIDKFFKALGWDVAHDVQTNPYEQEVRIEKRVKKGNAKGRADYAFSLAPQYNRPVFFVEAKKPSANLETADNYFQAIRYSWNAQLPLVVLTDFANFHVIDARYRPHIGSALARKHASFTYREYADKEKFSKIYWLFSKEALASGSFSRYVHSLEEKPADLPAQQMGLFGGGYTSIDVDFLAKLDEYRETLARCFKRENENLSSEQLTEMVQRTIDRLVFLRFLEDKLIEPEPIVSKIAADNQPWRKFVQESRRLDSIYNGVVFKTHSELDQVDLLRDSADFSAICDELSNAHSPYDFNSIPVEMLGRIYENFLGKVVLATAKRVSVEEKPAVRQAGGVYYTPDYIVRYMVEQSLDAIMQNRKEQELLGLRMIDTSCGSGSFLIGAYEALIRRVGKLFYAHPKLAKAGEWIERDGKWQLSFKKKRELLVHCLHGVDIDAQAVEVAQLSLYLKLMEDETTESAHQLQREFDEALLPRLNRNIIVGNALTGPLDDAQNQDLFLSESSADYGAVNLRLSFSQVMNTEKGFDLVIGNPPYIKEYTHRDAFEGVRQSPYYQGKMDLWYLFACRGLDLLKPKQGRLALIATNNWTTNSGASKLREKICKDARIEQLIDFGDFKVFRDAGIQTMILIAAQDRQAKAYSFDYRRLEMRKPQLKDALSLLEKSDASDAAQARQVRLNPMFDRSQLQGKTFNFSAANFESLLDAIAQKSNFQLNGKTEVAQGIVPNPDVLSTASFDALPKSIKKLGHIQPQAPVFVVPKASFSKLSKKAAQYLKPLVEPQDLKRYQVVKENRLEIIYASKRLTTKTPLPPVFIKHLEPFKSVLVKRREVKSGSIEWFNLHWPRDPEFFSEQPRILAVRKCAEPTFAYVEKALAVMMAFNIIKTERINLKYLTALLNSKLIKFWLKHRGKMQGKMFQVDKEPLLTLPLHAPPEPVQKQFAKWVDQILTHHHALMSASTEVQKQKIERLIEVTDEQIQQTIYDLYGLKPDQIEWIEKN